MDPLEASALFTEDGCEHQEFTRPVIITEGDPGSVNFNIGSVDVAFPSRVALMDALALPGPQ